MDENAKLEAQLEYDNRRDVISLAMRGYPHLSIDEVLEISDKICAWLEKKTDAPADR